MRSINSGLVNFKEQSEIIRIVSNNMIQHDKSKSDQITEVAVSLEGKYPVLKA